MKSLEQRVQYLEDEAAIRSLTARFSDSVVVGDFDKFKSFWSPDGKWTIHDPFFASATGVLKIDTLLRNLRKEREFFVQFVHSGVIDINGDKAIARWMMREVAKGPAQFYYDNYAIYVDLLDKANGQWRFIQRDYFYIWLNTRPFLGDAVALPSNLF
jgi:hypothetical protein